VNSNLRADWLNNYFGLLIKTLSKAELPWDVKGLYQIISPKSERNIVPKKFGF